MKPPSFKVCGNCNHYTLRLSQEDLAFIEDTMNTQRTEILKEWSRGRVFKPGRRTKDTLAVDPLKQRLHGLVSTCRKGLCSHEGTHVSVIDVACAFWQRQENKNRPLE